LTFKSVSGAAFTLDGVSSSQCIKDLMEQFIAATGIPEVRFISNGTRLEEARTIADYNLTAQSLIHYTPVLRGC
jgi:hypothetical protein